MATEINSEKDFTNIVTDEDVSVVKFYANYCGACKKIKEPYNDFARDNDDINVIAIDTENDTENIAQKFNISSIPTFMIFKNGKILESFSGGDIERLKSSLLKIRNKDNTDEEHVPVIEITSIEQYLKYVTGPKISIVKFGSETCPPCRQTKKPFSDMAAEDTNNNYLIVDIDNLEELAEASNIMSIPTFKIYKKGILKKSIVGSNMNYLKHTISELSYSS